MNESFSNSQIRCRKEDFYFSSLSVIVISHSSSPPTPRTLASGTFKSTRTKTFLPARSTFLASPSTLSFSQQAAEAWNCRKNGDEEAAATVDRPKNRVEREVNMEMKNRSKLNYCGSATSRGDGWLYNYAGKIG
jgi:hypothetical protein